MVHFCRLVPESTRWLAVRGRRDEAEKILRHAAKINNRKCPDQILVLEDKDTSVGRVSLLALRSSPLLMVRCIVICLNWWVVFLFFFLLIYVTVELRYSGDPNASMKKHNAEVRAVESPTAAQQHNDLFITCSWCWIVKNAIRRRLLWAQSTRQCPAFW